MITVVSLALVLIATAIYFVFRVNRCSANNDVAHEQYKNNRPSVPDQFIADGNQKAIAKLLVPLWLAGFTSRNADARIKIKEYEVHEIDIGQWNDDQFAALATVSVRPMKRSREEWLKGSGERLGDWVRNKSLSFTIEKDGDSFKVHSVGSYPQTRSNPLQFSHLMFRHFIERRRTKENE